MAGPQRVTNLPLCATTQQEELEAPNMWVVSTHAEREGEMPVCPGVINPANEAAFAANRDEFSLINNDFH